MHLSRFGTALLGLSLVLVASCYEPGGSSKTIERSNYGTDWPLTADSAVLKCDAGGAVTVTVKGHRFALNGPARERGITNASKAEGIIDPTGVPRLAADGRKLCGHG